jgi:hypothetical protein
LAGERTSGGRLPATFHLQFHLLADVVGVLPGFSLIHFRDVIAGLTAANLDEREQTGEHGEAGSIFHLVNSCVIARKQHWQEPSSDWKKFAA